MKKNGLKLAIISVTIIWLAVGFASVCGKGGIRDIRIARQKAVEMLSDVKNLEKENEALKQEIKELETSPSVYEKPAREKLMLKKPGEIVIYLPSQDVKKDTTDNSSH